MTDSDEPTTQAPENNADQPAALSSEPIKKPKTRRPKQKSQRGKATAGSRRKAPKVELQPVPSKLRSFWGSALFSGLVFAVIGAALGWTFDLFVPRWEHDRVRAERDTAVGDRDRAFGERDAALAMHPLLRFLGPEMWLYRSYILDPDGGETLYLANNDLVITPQRIELVDGKPKLVVNMLYRPQLIALSDVRVPARVGCRTTLVMGDNEVLFLIERAEFGSVKLGIGVRPSRDKDSTFYSECPTTG